MEDIQQYIEMVEKDIIQYMSMIFENGYDKNILKRFFDEYISVRYFNMNKDIKDKKDLYKSIIDELEKNAKKLVKVYNKADIDIIKEAFVYIINFDDIQKNIKDENVVNDIAKFRTEKLGIKTNASFSKKMLKEIKFRKEQKEVYVKKLLGGEVFKLKLKKSDNKDVQLAIMSHNIAFPSSINSKIIKQVFNTGIIAEDKLLVEYHMVNGLIIQDIIKGDFNKKYIAEFSNDLLNKKGKLDRTLKVISNEFQKERIYLLVEYKELNDNNKNKIYDLIRQGYNVAIRLDETFTFEENDIRKLSVFSYIIINDDKEKSKLKKYKDLLDKILKI